MHFTQPDGITVDARPPLLLSAREAAALLSISARTLWSLTKTGDVRSVRIGRSVRYAPADLEAFVASRKGV